MSKNKLINRKNKSQLIEDLKNERILIADDQYHSRKLIEWADALNVLRIQRERMGVGLIPSVREYRDFFGITLVKLFSKPPPVILAQPFINFFLLIMLSSLT